MLRNINLFGENLGININNPTVLQDIFDIIHPIGEVYIQYPQQKSPTELFNNTSLHSVWEEQLQYNGCFFRSENTFNTNTIVYSVDGVRFYKDSNLTQPISVKGLETPTHIGGNQYRLTSTPGKANNFISGSGTLSKQSNQNLNHQHSLNHNHNLSSHYHSLSSHTHPLTNVTGSGSIEYPKSSSNDHYPIDYGLSNAKTISSIGYSISGRTEGASTSNTSGPYNSSGTAESTATTGASDENTGYNGSDEFRPDNYTIRIWERIA